MNEAAEHESAARLELWPITNEPGSSSFFLKVGLSVVLLHPLKWYGVRNGVDVNHLVTYCTRGMCFEWPHWLCQQLRSSLACSSPRVWLNTPLCRLRITLIHYLGLTCGMQPLFLAHTAVLHLTHSLLFVLFGGWCHKLNHIQAITIKNQQVYANQSKRILTVDTEQRPTGVSGGLGQYRGKCPHYTSKVVGVKNISIALKAGMRCQEIWIKLSVASVYERICCDFNDIPFQPQLCFMLFVY